jgi:hypothetical protein
MPSTLKEAILVRLNNVKNRAIMPLYVIERKVNAGNPHFVHLLYNKGQFWHVNEFAPLPIELQKRSIGVTAVENRTETHRFEGLALSNEVFENDSVSIRIPVQGFAWLKVHGYRENVRSKWPEARLRSDRAQVMKVF